MAATIFDGSLQYSAGIDDSELTNDVNKLEKDLMRVYDAADKANKKTIESQVKQAQAMADSNGYAQRLELALQQATHQTTLMDSAMGKLALTMAGFFTAAQATQLVNQMVRVRSEFQQIDVSLQTMLKSKEKADALMSQVKGLALETPFNLLDIAQGTKQLLAYGFQANEIADTIKTLGNVASGVSAPLTDIIYLYGTLRTQGRAYTRDIMQFTSRGIPIVEQLAKQFSVTKDKVQELAEAGKIGFPDVEKAFKSLTEQGGLFYDLMAKQSKTLQGQISNLQDKFDFMLNDLGTKSQGFISGAIGLASELVGHYGEILKVIATIAAGYGTYRAAIIAVTVAEQVHLNLLRASALTAKELDAVQALRFVMLNRLRNAWRVLNATIASNPIGLAVVALTGVVTALVLIDNKAKSVTERLRDMRDAAENFAQQDEGVRKLVKEYEDLSEKTSRTEEETTRLHEVSKKLADLFPDETGKINNLTGAYEENTKAILANQDAKRNAQLDDLFKQRLAYEQQIFAMEKDLELGFKSITNANGTTNSVPLKPQDRDAIKKDMAQIQKLIDGISEAENTILKGGGTFTIYKPGEAQNLETVAKRVSEINTKLRDQRAILAQQRSPQSTATTDQINATLDKIKELEKELKTFQGPTGSPAPLAPTLDFSQLGKTAAGDLKKSLDDIKPELTDEAETFMQGIIDNMTLGAQTVLQLQNAGSGAALEFQNFWKSVLEDPVNDSMTVLKQKITEIDKILDSGFFKDTKGQVIEITPVQVERLRQIKSQLEQSANSGTALWNRARELTGIFSDLSNSTSGFSEGLSQTLDIMGSLVNDGVNFKNSIEEAKEGFKAAGDGGLTNIVAGISGALGAVGAVVGVVTSVLNVINKAQAEREQARADHIAYQNQLLEKQLDLVNDIYGIEKLQKYSEVESEINADRQKNAEMLINQFKKYPELYRLGGISPEVTKTLRIDLETENFDKFEEDIAAVADKLGKVDKAAVDAILNDNQLIKQLDEDTSELFSGISFDSLTDEIVQMFADGKTAAADFADTFEDLMKGAILNSFKTQYIQEQLKGWYDQFVKLSRSDNALTNDEVSKLRGDLNTIIENAKVGWDQLQKAAGLDFSASLDNGLETQNSLSGAIKGITENTADLLAGQFNAIRLEEITQTNLQKNMSGIMTRQISVMMQQLNYAIKIETNTGRTAANTAVLSNIDKSLRSIDGKISDADATKRANGVK